MSWMVVCGRIFCAREQASGDEALLENGTYPTRRPAAATKYPRIVAQKHTVHRVRVLPRPSRFCVIGSCNKHTSRNKWVSQTSRESSSYTPYRSGHLPDVEQQRDDCAQRGGRGKLHACYGWGSPASLWWIAAAEDREVK